MKLNRLPGRGAPLLAAVLFASVTATAEVDNKVMFGPAETVTAVSGYSGAYVDLGGGEDYQSIYGIGWWEEGDDPCKLTAVSHHMNLFGTKEWSTSFIGCSSPGNLKSAYLPGNSDNVYKVQVCTTDKDKTIENKLKGLRVWARSIDYKNPVKFTDQASPQEQTHTHCKKWHTAVECPAGQVASKVRVHYRTPNEITGLALVCRPVINKK